MGNGRGTTDPLEAIKWFFHCEMAKLLPIHAADTPLARVIADYPSQLGDLPNPRQCSIELIAQLEQLNKL